MWLIVYYIKAPHKFMKGKITMNVNGWPVIEMLLFRKRKNQSDLSRLLGVSPAAITQAKQGEFQLNAPALEKILHYLGATADEQNDFYTRVIQSRIFGKLTPGIICQVIITRREKE